MRSLLLLVMRVLVAFTEWSIFRMIGSRRVYQGKEPLAIYDVMYMKGSLRTFFSYHLHAALPDLRSRLPLLP